MVFGQQDKDGAYRRLGAGRSFFFYQRQGDGVPEVYFIFVFGVFELCSYLQPFTQLIVDERSELQLFLLGLLLANKAYDFIQGTLLFSRAG